MYKEPWHSKRTLRKVKVWKEIMNKGDFAYNCKVFCNEKGEIIPSKRPSKPKQATNYVECSFCSETYLNNDLWRHVKSSHSQINKKLKMFRKHQVASAAIMPVSKVAEPAFRENVLDKMSNDKVALIARNDSEICSYGQRMYKKIRQTPPPTPVHTSRNETACSFLSII